MRSTWNSYPDRVLTLGVTRITQTGMLPKFEGNTVGKEKEQLLFYCSCYYHSIDILDHGQEKPRPALTFVQTEHVHVEFIDFLIPVVLSPFR